MILIVAITVSLVLLVKLKLEILIKFQKNILRSMTKHTELQHIDILTKRHFCYRTACIQLHSLRKLCNKSTGFAGPKIYALRI
jgi:hypothetical protein